MNRDLIELKHGQFLIDVDMIRPTFDHCFYIFRRKYSKKLQAVCVDGYIDPSPVFYNTTGSAPYSSVTLGIKAFYITNNFAVPGFI